MSNATTRELLRLVAREYSREITNAVYPYVLAATVFAVARWDRNRR